MSKTCTHLRTIRDVTKHRGGFADDGAANRQ